MTTAVTFFDFGLMLFATPMFMPVKPAVPRYVDRALSPSEAVAAWDLRAVIAARTS